MAKRNNYKLSKGTCRRWSTAPYTLFGYAPDSEIEVCHPDKLHCVFLLHGLTLGQAADLVRTVSVNEARPAFEAYQQLRRNITDQRMAAVAEVERPTALGRSMPLTYEEMREAMEAALQLYLRQRPVSIQRRGAVVVTGATMPTLGRLRSCVMSKLEVDITSTRLKSRR